MKKNFLLAMVLLVAVVFLSAMTYADKEQKITQVFQWVKGHMGIQKDYPMPPVEFVAREKLQAIFEEETKESFRKIEESCGKEAAQKSLKFYLENIAALFIPRTGEIFVLDYTDKCERYCKLAHEFAHFFQRKKEKMAQAANEMQVMLLEIEAEVVEAAYKKTEAFCQK